MTKYKKLQFHTIKKWLYEQILCLPLCQSQTVPTSPLTAAAAARQRRRAPVRVRGNTIKKSSKPCAQGRKKGTTQARRAQQARAPLGCSGRPVGLPACRRSLKPLRSGHCNAQAYGRGKQRKRNDREKMYINAPRLQAQCRPCTPQCTPMQDPALPMRRECKRRL